MFQFRPKLFDCLRGYDRTAFLHDLAAGVTPAQGLWTAIIAGFLISAPDAPTLARRR